jgi:hypothetical protein
MNNGVIPVYQVTALLVLMGDTKTEGNNCDKNGPKIKFPSIATVFPYKAKKNHMRPRET